MIYQIEKGKIVIKAESDLESAILVDFILKQVFSKPDLEKHKCQTCGFTSQTRRGLSIHLASKHGHKKDTTDNTSNAL